MEPSTDAGLACSRVHLSCRERLPRHAVLSAAEAGQEKAADHGHIVTMVVCVSMFAAVIDDPATIHGGVAAAPLFKNEAREQVPAKRMAARDASPQQWVTRVGSSRGECSTYCGVSSHYIWLGEGTQPSE